ncbi:MAG: hypothetical protein L0I76_08495 [Pseudonocardia sp.]|nr:hypothetical protein [Pseudonocardia sp.]
MTAQQENEQRAVVALLARLRDQRSHADRLEVEALDEVRALLRDVTDPVALRAEQAETLMSAVVQMFAALLMHQDATGRGQDPVAASEARIGEARKRIATAELLGASLRALADRDVGGGRW